jgi:hypothetical protein
MEKTPSQKHKTKKTAKGKRVNRACTTSGPAWERLSGAVWGPVMVMGIEKPGSAYTLFAGGKVGAGGTVSAIA